MKKTWKVQSIKMQSNVDGIAEELEYLVPKDKLQSALLIFEEVCANITKYAYEDDGYIQITFSTKGNQTIFYFEDSGKEFNTAEYVPAPPDGMQIGGHGIRIVKELSSEITYQRKNGKNYLKIML